VTLLSFVNSRPDTASFSLSIGAVTVAAVRTTDTCIHSVLSGSTTCHYHTDLGSHACVGHVWMRARRCRTTSAFELLSQRIQQIRWQQLAHRIQQIPFLFFEVMKQVLQANTFEKCNQGVAGVVLTYGAYAPSSSCEHGHHI